MELAEAVELVELVALAVMVVLVVALVLVLMMIIQNHSGVFSKELWHSSKLCLMVKMVCFL